MKAKYIVLIIVFVVIIAAGILLFSFSRQLKEIKVKIEQGSIKFAENNPFASLDIDSIQDAAKFLDNVKTLDFIITISIENFSKRDFVLNQIYAKLSDSNKSFTIGEIAKPLSQPYTIKANSTTQVPIFVRLNSINVVRALFGNGNLLDNIGNLIELATNLGKHDKFFVVEGFLRLQNNWLRKSFEKTIDV